MGGYNPVEILGGFIYGALALRVYLLTQDLLPDLVVNTNLELPHAPGTNSPISTAIVTNHGPLQYVKWNKPTVLIPGGIQRHSPKCRFYFK